MAVQIIEPRDRYGFGIGLYFVWLAILVSPVVLVEPAPYDLLMVALFCVFAVTGLIRLPARTGVLLALLSGFVLANLVAGFFSFDLVRSLFYMGVTIYLALSALFVACLLYEDYERASRAIWNAYLIAAVAASILAVIGYFHLLPGSELFTRGGRARALFKDPNVLGPFLVPAAIYFFSRSELSSWPRMITSLVCLPMILVGVLLTFSRGAWANLLASFTIYVLLRVTIYNRLGVGRLLLFVVVIGVAATGLLWWIIVNTDAGQTFAAKAKLFRYYDVDRFGAQERGLAIAFSSILGIGPGLSEQALAKAAHSLYVRVFVESGWLGGLTFLAFTGIAAFHGLSLLYRGMRDTRLLVAVSCLMGILLNSFVIDSIHWRHFWLLLGLVWGAILQPSNHSRVVLPTSEGACTSREATRAMCSGGGPTSGAPVTSKNL
jgi:hypothetical protein